jgi:hypothetical protein
MGQAAKKLAAKKNMIGDFWVEKIDADVILAFAKEHKIKLDADKDSTPEQLAVALTMHFRDTVKDPDAFAKCENCGGEAHEDFEICPFCGLEGVEASDDEEEEPATEIEAVEVEAPKGKKTKKSKKGDYTMGAAVKINTGSNKALTKAEKSGLAISEADLDTAVKHVIQLKSDASVSYWELGGAILEINEKGLWKLRLGENGKARYSGFDAFCHHELNMSVTNAFNMMACARDYTREDVAAMGKSKAVLILKAAPEDRKELQEKAKKGASFRDVEKGVKESKKKRSYTGATPAAKRGSKGGHARAEKHEKNREVAQDKITIAKIEGIKTVKLYARPASLKNLDLDACKRAKTIKDQPFGRLELVNGVAMFISIVVGKDGSLAAKIDTRRESLEA